MGLIEWYILLLLVALGVNVKLLIGDIKRYIVAKREQEPKVMIRADELAKVIAEFVNE